MIRLLLGLCKWLKRYVEKYNVGAGLKLVPLLDWESRWEQNPAVF